MNQIFYLISCVIDNSAADNPSKHTRRLTSSASKSIVSVQLPAAIDPGHSIAITVTAKDSAGNPITTGGEYFLVNDSDMIDNGNGTYSYSEPLNYAG